MHKPHPATWLIVLAMSGLAPLAIGAQTPPAATDSANPDQAALVREVAAATGKDPAALNALLDSAVVKQSLLDGVARPIFVNPERIAEGAAFYREHHVLLEQIAKQYGVPPQFIVAIIGVETNYGENTGNYRVLDALATLAFHYPPRAQYFQGELKALLELPANKLPGPIPDIYGSYAGAEGLGQFMPSSIRDYGVDADGDSHINLFASLPDAFASVANYFRAHGWQTGQPVAVRADPSATAAPPPAYQNVMPQTPLAQLAAQGYAPTTQENPSLPANLLTLAGANGTEYWLTFRNFYVITRYNHSPRYAMAVTQLADAIAREVAIAATPAAQ